MKTVPKNVSVGVIPVELISAPSSSTHFIMSSEKVEATRGPMVTSANADVALDALNVTIYMPDPPVPSFTSPMNCVSWPGPMSYEPPFETTVTAPADVAARPVARTAAAARPANFALCFIIFPTSPSITTSHSVKNDAPTHSGLPMIHTREPPIPSLFLTQSDQGWKPKRLIMCYFFADPRPLTAWGSR